MIKKWRILKIREDCAAMQMAIDEAIMMTRSMNKVVNTLRFYTWKPAAVSIGFFQSLEKEVDKQKLKEYGYDVVRRYTGGGAVLHDKEITYSIILSDSDVPSDIIKSYEKICSGIIRGLGKLNLNGEFKPINDIIVNGKKISGNAQTRKNGIVLQHGTILIDVNIEKMFSVLKVPDEKLKDKIIKIAAERVTCINKESEKEVSIKELEDVLKQGLEEVFKVTFIYDNLTKEEEELAQKLYKEKYSTEEWSCCR